MSCVLADDKDRYGAVDDGEEEVERVVAGPELEGVTDKISDKAVCSLFHISYKTPLTRSCASSAPPRSRIACVGRR